MNRGLSALAVAWILTGCGTHDASQLKDEDRPTRTLVVLSGGNSSCGDGHNPANMGLWKSFKQRILDRAVNATNQIHYIMSCFETSDPEVYYYTSDAPDTIVQTDFAGWYDVVNNTRESLDADRFVAGGHSYGGWLVMKMGLEMRTNIDKLVTIDPISRVRCTFASPGGCTASPADITTEQREMLAQRSMDWLNVYQTRTFYLHASPISQADTNTHLNYSHGGIETSRELWDAISPSMLNEDGAGVM